MMYANEAQTAMTAIVIATAIPAVAPFDSPEDEFWSFDDSVDLAEAVSVISVDSK